MGNLLYQVSPRDPLVFGLAFVLMAFVSLVACFFACMAGDANRSSLGVAELILSRA